MTVYQKTAVGNVWLEASSNSNYWRYVNHRGERWEVHGTCDKRGNCLIGAVLDGEEIKTIERARELALAYEGLDWPVYYDFSGCCDFKYVILDPIDPSTIPK